MKRSAKSPRTIVVKTLLNADEFLEFDRACSSSDVTHSGVLREFVKGFVARVKNGMTQPAKKEWPGAGQNMAMFSASRRGVFGPARMQLRL